MEVEPRKSRSGRRLSEPASEQLSARRPVIYNPFGRTAMDFCMRSDQSFLPAALNNSEVPVVVFTSKAARNGGILRILLPYEARKGKL
ncbi:hypothetical protein D918_00162 [Trichuris suis]|nr:hypothetical protein D918_00162 [Trichuris suis]